MSKASYSFLPYLRQGLSNSLQSGGDARGTFTVKLEVHGKDANGNDKSAPVGDKVVELYGPGDVVGIDSRSIIKTDPHNWITNFENNYLAYIDFYDEDFPWRYAPVPPSGQRLNPWIALVVLADGEFTEGQNLADRPLPYITVKDTATRDNFFPKADQLWAWAHVHVNGDITPSDDTIVVGSQSSVDTALDQLQVMLNDNADRAYSRLLCSRRLMPTKSYNAFVIPVYESGRLAGSGANATDIANAKLTIAWEGPNLEFPYYYRWKFNTGTIGDFEYLVRLLKPKVADSRIGRRVMDMTNPKGNIIWKEDPANPLGGILRLGGALRVPKESLTTEENEKVEKFDKWAQKNFPEFHPFEVQLAALLNLADDYSIKGTNTALDDVQQDGTLPIDPVDPNEDADPLITPPVYGRWHAMIERVYKDRDGNAIDNNYNWVTELNLDPRFRVPAHFGTRVVQQNQEDYMQAAWEQIGDVLKGNTQIRFSQFAMLVSASLYLKHFTQSVSTQPSKLMLLTAPLHKRIMLNNATLFYSLRQSVIPNAVVSAPMRRIARPRGRIVMRLQKQLTGGQQLRLESIVTDISTGHLLPAPPKTDPPGLPTVQQVADQVSPAIPPFLKSLMEKYPWLQYAAFGIALLILLLLLILGATGVLLVIGLAAAGALAWLGYKITGWQKALKAVEAIAPQNQTPQSVDLLPKSADFKLRSPDESFRPTTGAVADNAAAISFKNSLKDTYTLLQFVKTDIPAVREPLAIEMTAAASTVVTQINPEKTVPAWLKQQVFLPAWIKDQQVDDGIVEAKAYPKINRPMYEDLKKISDELFLPNVQLIAPNSITLLETNQEFIESYMVGLNHEFARELLWREYPTDQRGSYFRQFWDVSSLLKDPALASKSEDEQREPFYDIPKLHEWRRTSKLGTHDNRQQPGEEQTEEVVLVIRGELLKKYPTAVVYAHKADWTVNDKTNQIDTKLVRSLYMPEEGDKDKPDTTIIKTPLYAAKIDPDIYFFGFDLTVPVARGESNPQTPNRDNAGWFFVIKERDGEPRFGFDIPATDGSNKDLVTWNDLAWDRVMAAEEGIVDVLHPAGNVTLPSTPPDFPDDTEGKGQEAQYKDDINVVWNGSVDAANLAYILYQVPTMVCVHASEMVLPQNS